MEHENRVDIKNLDKIIFAIMKEYNIDTTKPEGWEKIEDYLDEYSDCLEFANYKMSYEKLCDLFEEAVSTH
ncbi:MAG TPA: hypothetical protein PLL17_00455 [Defluviitaleaceae bacterium]|jgi:hypothetical protein|nr:hypothetical protein [Candidatus Epulonipiscium sp.]HOQ17003.1 hypothetical protein [Defluviitaleaceae bacterium]HPT77211.1 hypothetical protein [Defluviitaleaceae bacterium]HQD49591.1 hypothetical protein [Defluviitaleaceae bacterium]